MPKPPFSVRYSADPAAPIAAPRPPAAAPRPVAPPRPVAVPTLFERGPAFWFCACDSVNAQPLDHKCLYCGQPSPELIAGYAQMPGAVNPGALACAASYRGLKAFFMCCKNTLPLSELCPICDKGCSAEFAQTAAVATLTLPTVEVKVVKSLLDKNREEREAEREKSLKLLKDLSDHFGTSAAETRRSMIETSVFNLFTPEMLTDPISRGYAGEHFAKQMESKISMQVPYITTNEIQMRIDDIARQVRQLSRKLIRVADSDDISTVLYHTNPHIVILAIMEARLDPIVKGSSVALTALKDWLCKFQQGNAESAAGQRALRAIQQLSM